MDDQAVMFAHGKPCPHGGADGSCSWCDLRDDGGLPESKPMMDPEVQQAIDRWSWALGNSVKSTIITAGYRLLDLLQREHEARIRLERERDELLLDRHQPGRVSPCGHYRVFTMPCVDEDGIESPYCMQCNRDELQVAASAAHEARKQAEQRLEDVYVKDRGKTNEINLLVTENRNLLRERDEARAELASCHERLEDMLGQ